MNLHYTSLTKTRLEIIGIVVVVAAENIPEVISRNGAELLTIYPIVVGKTHVENNCFDFIPDNVRIEKILKYLK